MINSLEFRCAPLPGATAATYAASCFNHDADRLAPSYFGWAVCAAGRARFLAARLGRAGAAFSLPSRGLFGARLLH